jgi:hypothetical protein
VLSALSVHESAAPSLLIIETGASAIALGFAFCWPRLASPLFADAERLFGCLARRQRLSVLTVGLSALLIRLCVLPLMPIPQPFIHDEFSFLLAADTFASGRVTNPTHPMWQYLESFHITQKPSYMSMYFPAQGMILAAGKKLAGNPWYGVCVSAALMCSAMCWMLQGWLPPGWALLGGILAVFRLALFSYWVNGYYGGAVAAIGGALVLGALPRIMRKARVSDGLLMALGIALLANTRPYEGMLLCIPVCCALIWWLWAEPHPPALVLFRRAAVPATLLALTAGCMGWYNYRVFGDPFTLPYQVNRATYASAPVFLWESPRKEPVYRHPVMREFYTGWELRDFLYARTPAGFVSGTVKKLAIVVLFFYGTALFAPLVMLPWVVGDPRVRFLVAAGAVYSLGLCLNAWLFPHYLAPFAGGLYVFLLQAMRHLRAWRPGRQPYGLALVRILPVLCVLLAGVRVFAAPLGIGINRWPTMWYGTEPLGLARARVANELESRSGLQLAIVRYSATHSVFDDWVYNAADVDKAKVVWAREMDRPHNAELLKYFGDRGVWLVEPDSTPPRITPYVFSPPAGLMAAGGVPR